jgi:hypothetical protein
MFRGMHAHDQGTEYIWISRIMFASILAAILYTHVRISIISALRSRSSLFITKFFSWCLPNQKASPIIMTRVRNAKPVRKKNKVRKVVEIIQISESAVEEKVKSSSATDSKIIKVSNPKLNY